MTELERRALLGDKQAQAKCTDKGIVLPCPFCGNEPIIEDNRVFCGVCGLAYEELDSGLSLRAWNTRQAPPIGSCSECAHRYKGHCTSGPCDTEETDADFYCGNFKEKENEDNALL